MDTETMIRELKSVEEKHKNDAVYTGQLNIAEMAHDVRRRIEELKPYEDTGLTPAEIRDLKEPIMKLQEHFGDAITVAQVIDSFVDFYIAQGDSERVEEAVLLTNEEVARYRELKERDTAKAPDVHKNKFSDAYTCPNCNLAFIHKDTTGWFCGKQYKFCPDCGQRLTWEE